jgi:hypothetical protein
MSGERFLGGAERSKERDERLGVPGEDDGFRGM